ncbi:E3 ubiquitin ligase RNF157 isoform X4 [Stigmatopora argus]
MGAFVSRQNIGVEEVDIPSNSVYRYPPKSGSYFASHFIMGGEKFDSTHPEGYLFGENTDLNFLGTRPVAFPYAAPPPQEPVKTLRSLINIRKDTLRLVRCSEDLKLPGDDEDGKQRVCYNVEFAFDADTPVAITIYYQALEEFHNGVPVYLPQDSSLQSETVHFKRGVSQQFCLPSHTVNLSEWADEELLFDADREIFPMVVQATADEGDEHLGHSHILLATFEKHMDGSFCVKPLKQKQVVDGVSYLLQEIYGIENKYNSQESKVADDEISDNSAECVVCLSDVRDTLILPCRHLCLCNACADTLRYQANCCPICRLPFRALLQIRAMRKKVSPLTPTNFNPVITSQTSDSEEHSVLFRRENDLVVMNKRGKNAVEHIPPGYEAVSLLEALNGPLATSSVTPPLHSGPSHVTGALPPYGSEAHPAAARSCSPLDHSNSSQGLKLKKSASKSLSQNSSVLPEEEDEKSCSELEARHRKLGAESQECGVTPDSENLTLSSSGAIDQSPCTGTPLSSTITSPEGSYLAGADGEPGGGREGVDAQGEETRDAPVESRGPSQMERESLELNYSVGVEEQDLEGNDVTEDDRSSQSNGKGGRSKCPELANNNQGVALCDTPSLGLDNEQAPDGRFADLMYLGSYRPVLDSTSNQEQGIDNQEGQAPKHPHRGPLIV